MTRITLPLPAGVTALRVASGRTGATRWETWRGAPDLGTWLGDLVRWMPEGTWDWQPATGPAVVEGTLDECAAALAAAATAATPANPVPAREYEPGYDAAAELQGWMNEVRSARRDGRA